MGDPATNLRHALELAEFGFAIPAGRTRCERARAAREAVAQILARGTHRGRDLARDLEGLIGPR